MNSLVIHRSGQYTDRVFVDDPQNPYYRRPSRVRRRTEGYTSPLHVVPTDARRPKMQTHRMSENLWGVRVI